MVLRYPTRGYQSDRASRTADRTATRPADHTNPSTKHPHARNHRPSLDKPLSISVGGLDRAARFLEQLDLFQLSASLGSVESLVVHPASMWKAMLTQEELANAGLDPGLVRLACGQEDVADLIEDLDKALDSLRCGVP